jgi:glycosyltransferase involved in cell wall biosynthesis
MRIGIDARGISKSVGIGVYVSNLVRNMIRLDNGVECVLYVVKEDANLLAETASVRTVWGSLENHAKGDFWEQLVLPVELTNNCIDVYHGTNARLPFAKAKAKYVLTIHDLIPLMYPELNSRAFSYYMSKMLKLSAARADLIIAVSENTRRDIVRSLSVSADKIRVVHEGVDRSFKPLDKTACADYVKRKYGLEKGFILFVGRLEPRKNVTGLLTGFRLLLDRTRADLSLALVGGMTWIHDEIMRSISEQGLDDRVHLIHGATHGELPLLYNSASVFVLPSLYEGFGLPLVEAMACGTPVVASNISSVPEIVGDAGILVDPRRPECIAEALEASMFEYAKRDELIRRGRERAKSFSWESVAAKTLDVYEESLAA